MILECINQSAIIGVIGTLSGVLLGFILNLVIRIGQIKIFINKISYSCLDEHGDPLQPETMDSNIHNIYISVNLDLYNTSSFNQKIGRDLYFVFQTTAGYVKKEIIDEAGEKFINFNLKPNELINHELHVSLDKDSGIDQNFKFFLEYKNSKDRLIRKNIPHAMR